ncbi:hypothetical protein CcCBS67573_g00814 [Chytriomyces confervae]|uniref:Major facilitator superfamily (MFS) profile domain-containing protein n=1 Tax=Chytriomyces confervae TaxID=246404 RepID=A0A507FSN9_9FUNG|nr:hypothetical protein CcCBS67573_g00814 [Chytriomyces confervae]
MDASRQKELESPLMDSEDKFLATTASVESLITDERKLEPPSDLPIVEGSLVADVAPDGGADAWMAVFASFTIHFLGLGVLYSFGIYAAYYSSNNLAPISVISFIGAIGASFLVGLGLVSGRLAEKFGFRVMIVIGAFVLSIGLLLASFSTQVWQLVLTQGVLVGTGMSLSYFPAVSLPSQWFEKRRGLATGIAVSGSGLGGLVMSLLTQSMLTKIGFEWTMRATALIILVGILAVIPFVKTRLPPAPQSKTDWAVFKDHRFLLLLGTGFFATFANLVPVYFLPAYSIDVVGVSKTDAAVLVSIYNGSSAVGRILIGIGADTVVGRLNSLILCTFLSSASMLFIWTFARSYALLVLFACVNGFVCGGYISLFPVVVGAIFGVKRLPSLIGTLMSISAIANLSGTPLAGVVRDAFGYTGLTLFSGLLTLVSVVFALIVRDISVELRIRVDGMDTTEEGYGPEWPICFDDIGHSVTISKGVTTIPRGSTYETIGVAKRPLRVNPDLFTTRGENSKRFPTRPTHETQTTQTTPFLMMTLEDEIPRDGSNLAKRIQKLNQDFRQATQGQWFEGVDTIQKKDERGSCLEAQDVSLWSQAKSTLDSFLRERKFILSKADVPFASVRRSVLPSCDKRVFRNFKRAPSFDTSTLLFTPLQPSI